MILINVRDLNIVHKADQMVSKSAWYIYKKGGWGIKPAYKFMMIISLLAIKFKLTPNGNPTNDTYWRQKSSSLNVVQ